MNSAVYLGKLAHARHIPKKHVFRYSVFMMYLDLDELPELAKKFRFFSLNRFNVFSFHDRDHFKFIRQIDRRTQVIARENIKYQAERYLGLSTKERVSLILSEAGLDFTLGRVCMMTNPRVLGYVFNPVSFYYCFDEGGTFRALLSEVNNTFGDQKMYLYNIEDPQAAMFTTRQQKNFYISPYTDYDNDLVWNFKLPDDRVLMAIDTLKGGELELKATFSGERREFSDRLLLWLNFRYPLLTLMIITRIHFQALKLFLKGLRLRDKTKTDDKIVQELTEK
jgi:hypothetical protein